MLTSAPIRRSIHVLLACCVVMFASAAPARADSVTRAEALEIAESYVNHRWSASAKNLRHGRDAAGIEVHTPDRAGGRGDPPADCWLVDSENTGMAYKWGGFDTPARFDAGVRVGKAAGDVYTTQKRVKGGAAVSADAVGIDCSGFVSRCWKLSEKHSTSMLFGISERLRSADSLQPADIMNTANGHVLLFVRWVDANKKRALFYEAAPFSKTRASGRVIAELTADGYQPLRYRSIRD